MDNEKKAANCVSSFACGPFVEVVIKIPELKKVDPNNNKNEDGVLFVSRFDDVAFIYLSE